MITTAIAGSNSRIRRSSSMPFMPGSRTSEKTTSGRSVSSSVRACSASAATSAS
jgi:hypothetical protein